MQVNFDSFSTCDKNIWKSQIEKELKGVTYDTLSEFDRNEILRHPFYTMEDHKDSYMFPDLRQDWEICAHVEVKDPVIANAEALFFLNAGASGLMFVFEEPEEVDFNILLSKIELEYILLHFKFTKRTQNIIYALRSYLTKLGLDLNELNCIITFDPVASYTQGKQISFDDLEDEMRKSLDLLQFTKVLSVEGTLYQNTGANSTFELSCILSHVNEYLSFISDESMLNGIKKVHISVAVGTDFFEQIAKIRALRILMEFLLESYGTKAQVVIHAENSKINISNIDENNNLLRTSIMGMGAVLGGCDSLLIYPYKDECRSTKRLVINQQIIFKEESHFNKIIDASAGSYFIEDLTGRLAERAWDEFKKIEENGGFLASFMGGLIQSKIVGQRNSLLKGYKDGDSALIGVNKFKNVADFVVAEISKTNRDLNEYFLYPISISNELLEQ